MDRFRAHDGYTLAKIGVETSEQLDVILEQVRVIQHERVKRGSAVSLSGRGARSACHFDSGFFKSGRSRRGWRRSFVGARIWRRSRHTDHSNAHSGRSAVHDRIG
ncbi:hypothetical protein [Paraburkholderia phenoliruptrix]|uniref:hypothetical protein n=1 Tax=Paraburkholderia phenoliruptrix TaxID=252970 RepID=UPI003D35AE0A